MAARRKFVVFYGESEAEAKYLIRHTSLSQYRPEIRRIAPNDRTFTENPAFLRQMLYLDKPDIIVASGDPLRPVFGAEFSAEAPTGHDAFQRFARIVAAAEQGTPFAYLFPERKWVERGGGERWDEFNPLIVRALVQVSRFHQVPALPFLWPADRACGNRQQGYLLCASRRNCLPPPDCSEAEALLQFAELSLQHYLERVPFGDMVFSPFFADRETRAWGAYHARVAAAHGRDEWSPLTACSTQQTAELANFVRQEAQLRDLKLPEVIASRAETLVYRTNSRTFRADPFAGALAAVDYLRCRNGPTPQHRHTNLVMHFAAASIEQVVGRAQRYHRSECPLSKPANAVLDGDTYYTLHLRDGCRYTKQKEIRTICSFADMVIFRDGVIL